MQLLLHQLLEQSTTGSGCNAASPFPDKGEYDIGSIGVSPRMTAYMIYVGSTQCDWRLEYVEFGGKEVIPDTEFHPTQVSAVLTKRTHLYSATKE